MCEARIADNTMQWMQRFCSRFGRTPILILSEKYSEESGNVGCAVCEVTVGRLRSVFRVYLSVGTDKCWTIYLGVLENRVSMEILEKNGVVLGNWIDLGLLLNVESISLLSIVIS
jgi:hypothetical protein